MLPEYVNKNCRKFIEDYVDNMVKVSDAFDDEAFYDISLVIIDNIVVKPYHEESERIMHTLFKLLFMILVSDAYKLLNLKYKNNLLSSKEMILFDLLRTTDDIDLLINYINQNDIFMMYLVKSTYDFGKMGGLAKRTLVNNLSEKDNEHLNKICVTHESDLIKYNGILTREKVIEIYDVFSSYYHNLDVEISSDDIVNMIVNYLNDLEKNNKENYLKTIDNLSMDETFDNLEDLIRSIVKDIEYVKA